MPIYEYTCKKCNEDFELLQRVDADDEKNECPKCGSRQVKKKISSFSCACSFNSGEKASEGTRSGFGGGG